MWIGVHVPARRDARAGTPHVRSPYRTLIATDNRGMIAPCRSAGGVMAARRSGTKVVPPCMRAADNNPGGITTRHSAKDDARNDARKYAEQEGL